MGTQACQQHQRDWNRYLHSHTRQGLSGFRRMLRRPGENLPWQPNTTENIQLHDEPAVERLSILRTSIANGSWETWKQTSRFIVDAYHYTGHRTTDSMCRKWCNPAPLDGSAPNLVVAKTNSQGQTYYQRAFNTQACEQLNAWLGGFESILRKMSTSNFNWFVHTMLSYHTRFVIERQRSQDANDEGDGDDSGDSDSDGDGDGDGDGDDSM